MDAIASMTLAAAGAAVADDLVRRRVSNWIAGSAAAAGLAWHGLGGGLAGAGIALGGMAAGFGVFLAFYLLGGMGGGDVKLMAGLGALLGPAGILTAALFAAVAGALEALAVLAWRRLRAGEAPRAIPYAPAIALGALLALAGRN
jgi:prepilin peptidase CpaA